MAGLPKFSKCDDEMSSHSETSTVFQCKKCRTILADSSSLVYICEPLSYITFRAVHPLRFRIQERFEKSDVSNALLAGSSFQRVYCIKCSEEVGKVFKNLPAHLSQMAGHISLDVQQISSYEIPKVPSSVDQDSNDILNRIQQEVLKIQVVLINMNERLETIENALSLEEGTSE